MTDDDDAGFRPAGAVGAGALVLRTLVLFDTTWLPSPGAVAPQDPAGTEQGLSLGVQGGLGESDLSGRREDADGDWPPPWSLTPRSRQRQEGNRGNLIPRISVLDPGLLLSIINGGNSSA